MSTRSSHQSPVASAAPSQPSKPTLKYTHIAKGCYRRFRHPVTGDVPLPGDPDQPAFYRAYSVLLGRVTATSGKPVPAADKDKATLAWLIGDYQASSDFTQLAESTRSDYSRYLRRMVEEYGDRDFRRLTDAGVLAMRKARETSPRAADISVAVLSAVITYAINRRILPKSTPNPCHGIETVVHKVTPHMPWNEAQIAKALATLPEHVRDPVLVYLYTAQRNGTGCEMELGNFLGNIMQVRAHKTNELIDMPCPAALLEVVERRRKRPSKSNRLLLTKTGVPYNARLLAKDLRNAMRHAGLPPRLTIHGLRYASVGRLVDMGCDVEAIIAVTGHRCYEMAIKYLRSRKAAARASAAMDAHDAQTSAAAMSIANSKPKIANSRKKVQRFQ